MISDTIQEIADNVARISDNIDNAYTAISNKGGTLPATQDSGNLANAITSIPSGGGGYTLQNFIDDGGKFARTNINSAMMQGINQLDFSNVSDFTYYFNNSTTTDNVFILTGTFPAGFDGSSMFYGYNSINTIDLSGISMITGNSMNNMFGTCKAHTILATGIDPSGCGNLYKVFAGCVNLIKLDISGWNNTSAATFSPFNAQTSLLETLIGDHTLAEVEAGTIMTFINVGANVRLDYCPNLNRASLLAVIKGLRDLTGKPAKNLTLGNTLLAKLTATDIAIATNKNWNVV